MTGRHLPSTTRAGAVRLLHAAARHRWLTAMLVVVVGLTPVWWSLGDALANPQLGNSLSARAAEWVRDHGGGRLVVRAENAWYGRHAPPVGARLAPGAIPALPPAPSSSPAAADGAGADR